MMVWEKNTRKGWIMQASAPDLLDWQEQNHEFENLSGWTTRDFNFTGDEDPQRILGARVSPNFFRMLKVSPAMGRDFRSEEDHPGLGHVAMISAGMWRDRFNGDPQALGQYFSDGRRTVHAGRRGAGQLPFDSHGTRQRLGAAGIHGQGARGSFYRLAHRDRTSQARRQRKMLLSSP